uniref:Pep_M12B_propep domain-containing protein n=1 Tax=Steinernema glaseri TaxID=37863 RepID=A0A1I8A1N6_9BILA
MASRCSMLGLALVLSAISVVFSCPPATPAPPPVFQPQVRLTSFLPTSVTTRNVVPVSKMALPLNSAPRHPVVNDVPLHDAQRTAHRALSFFRPPLRRNDGLSHQLINNPVFHFTFSPPVSWTYCEPSCGTGDQSIDQESALDNALIDVKDALNSALSDLGLGLIGEHNIRFEYTPFNMLLREFHSEFYDARGFQYRTVGKTVRLETRRDSAEHNIVAHNATLRIVDSYTFSMTFWEKVGILFRKHLFPKGVEVNRGPSLVRATVERTTFNRRLTFHPVPASVVNVPAAPRAQVVPSDLLQVGPKTTDEGSVVPSDLLQVGPRTTDEGSGEEIESLLGVEEGEALVNSTIIGNVTLCDEC